MPNITLPDGKKLAFKEKVSGLKVAEKISKSLAKEALVISVDGKLKDLSYEIEKDCEVKVLTSKDKDGLDTIRHDTAHILAMAVQELFPGTQVTIGPTIEDGFYYDFSRKEPFTEADLKKIETKMSEIVDRDEPTYREVWDRDKAISHFKKIGENYKSEIIQDIPKTEEISIYFHGKWHDLCRGPHLSSTGKIGKNFKLTKVAGAYWRGDSKNEMLQRIYGTSWASKKDLDNYIKRLEEAEKRDHRKLGKELGLYVMSELVGSGLPFPPLPELNLGSFRSAPSTSFARDVAFVVFYIPFGYLFSCGEPDIRELLSVFDEFPHTTCSKGLANNVRMKTQVHQPSTFCSFTVKRIELFLKHI